MAIGKNKRISKGRKGGKKKAVDPFTRKEWYSIKAPAMFANRAAGKTLINKTAGNKIASDGLKGRVYEVNLADLNGGDETQSYRKIRLITEEVEGQDVLTNFHGMDMTRDKLCSLIRKWQSLIEVQSTVRTTDGYELRIFAIAFTKKQRDQKASKPAYAQASQIRAICKKMRAVISDEASKADLRELVNKFISNPESLALSMEKAAGGVFPIQNVFVRKVKVLRRPRFDLTKLRELHSASAEDAGAAVARPQESNVQSLKGAGGRL